MSNGSAAWGTNPLAPSVEPQLSGVSPAAEWREAESGREANRPRPACPMFWGAVVCLWNQSWCAAHYEGRVTAVS